MCGIAGVMSWSDRHEVTQAALRRMAGAIAHRGPDGEATLVNRIPTGGQIGLAFRRLAVLDCDARAMQPMSTPDERFTIVFNGEIYNYKTLRAGFAQDWRTTGDTEVLLHALARDGVAALPTLNGMFAIALWDAVEGTLLLARDRMGQKPLYYTTSAGSIAFASEISALNQWDDWDRTVDDEALTHYLRFGRIDAPHTMYRGVRQLPPGTWIKISQDGSASQRPTNWFDANSPSVGFQPTPAGSESAPDFRSLVSTAVQRQLVSDVPLGVFLSGGVDSSVIAACARQHGAVDTFSIGFDDPRYDETKYAQAVAQHLGTRHHCFHVTPDAADDLPKLAAVFGEPFGDSSALPTHYLARETRKHVTVALSGDGGDELFGGYDRYRAIGVPTGLFAVLAPLGRVLSGGHPKSMLTRAGRFLESAGLSISERYRSYLALFDEAGVRALLGDRATPPFSQFENFLRAGKTPAEAAMAHDRVTYLPNDLLTKVDRCSMLHALEVRSPFMDHDLVQAAAGLTKHQLLGGGPKKLLRDAFAKDLPSFVFSRRKMGFALPIGQWFRTSLRDMLRENLLASNSFCRSLHIQTVERLLNEHDTAARDHSQRLYALLMLELWHQQNLSRGIAGKGSG